MHGIKVLRYVVMPSKHVKKTKGNSKDFSSSLCVQYLFDSFATLAPSQTEWYFVCYYCCFDPVCVCMSLCLFWIVFVFVSGEQFLQFPLFVDFIPHIYMHNVSHAFLYLTHSCWLLCHLFIP